MRTNESGKAGTILLLLLVFLGLVYLCLAAVRVGDAPTIKITPDKPAIGKKTNVTVHVEVEKRGLGNVKVELITGDKARVVAEKPFSPSSSWKWWESGTKAADIPIEVGKATMPDLKPGTATIRATVERAGGLLRSPDPVTAELTLPVKLTPPSLQVLSTQTYVSQGGSEAVVYRVGEGATTSGVRAGERFFPGSPLPGGGPGDRFAIFGVPYDLGDPSGIRLVASDDVGNEATISFVDRFTPKPIKTETIRLDDGFLGRVVPEILSRTPELHDKGNLLDNYLQINGDLRKKNAEELNALADASPEKFLWTRAFQAMRDGKVMSSFADRRTYEYQGRAVDRQVHLGFDLASTRGAPIPASNDGTVVLARYFGIYGNAVVVDHGYGIMTLYGHLSSIDVSEGQSVAQGATLGRSGMTGLAGGDHLHFSILLHGLSVNPVEWWDAHWIQDRIERKLGAALPFSS